MKSKKVIVLLISLTLLVSMTLPATVVVSADQAADSGDRPPVSEDEGKDTSPEGAGDPEPPGLNQSADPSEPDENPDLSGPPEENQGADPSQPEEPGNTGEQNPCTCGAAQGEDHKEGCPLYVVPDVIPTEPAKVCTCGHEDGTHDEDCPKYEAPEGLEEEGEQAESNGASLIVSVQVSGEDNGNAVLNLTGPGDYCKRIVVHGSGIVTLSGLRAGEYTVSDGTASQSVTLQAGAGDSVDITVTRSSHRWLTGEAYQTFTFNS